MPTVTVTAAVGAKRRDSAGSGLGTGSRLAGAGSEASAVKKNRARLWLARGTAGAVNDQSSGLLEREEVEVTFKKPSPPSF